MLIECSQREINSYPKLKNKKVQKDRHEKILREGTFGKFISTFVSGDKLNNEIIKHFRQEYVEKYDDICYCLLLCLRYLY